MHNLCIDLIKHPEAPPINGTFSRGDFFDCFAMERERQFIKSMILRQMPADFLPKSAEVRFQFSIAPHMVVGIIPRIGHGKDMPHAKRTCHYLRYEKDEILRAEPMCAFGHLTNKILCIISIRSLHGSDYQYRFSIPEIEPKDNLVQMHAVHIHDHGEQSFFTLSRLEFKISSPFYIIFRRSPKLMDTVKTEMNKPLGV